jgi:hypothetical protein
VVPLFRQTVAVSVSGSGAFLTPESESGPSARDKFFPDPGSGKSYIFVVTIFWDKNTKILFSTDKSFSVPFQKINNFPFCETDGYKKRKQPIFFILLFCFLDRGSEIRYLGWTNHPGSATLIKTQGYAGATAGEHKTEKNTEFLGKYDLVYLHVPIPVPYFQ